MSTLTDLLIPILGTYDTSIKVDVPYIVAAVLLVIGAWFAFKVVLTIMHILGGCKK